jgi:hypothetical protein
VLGLTLVLGAIGAAVAAVLVLRRFRRQALESNQQAFLMGANVCLHRIGAARS